MHVVDIILIPFIICPHSTLPWPIPSLCLNDMTKCSSMKSRILFPHVQHFTSKQTLVGPLPFTSSTFSPLFSLFSTYSTILHFFTNPPLLAHSKPSTILLLYLLLSLLLPPSTIPHYPPLSSALSTHSTILNPSCSPLHTSCFILQFCTPASYSPLCIHHYVFPTSLLFTVLNFFHTSPLLLLFSAFPRVIHSLS